MSAAAELYPIEKSMPQAVEAERSILGAVFLDTAGVCVEQCAAILTRDDDWYVRGHARIWSAMRALSDAEQPIDPVTLRDELTRRGELERVGGAHYLAGLINGMPRVENIEQYAKIVRDKATARRLIAYGNRIVEAGLAGELKADELVDIAESDLLALSENRLTAKPEHIADVARRRLERLEMLQGLNERGKPSLTGVPTGFTELDYMLGGGLQPAQFIVIGARPRMGKTALAINIANSAALAGKRVLIVSAEMTADEIGDRSLASEAHVDVMRLKQAYLNREEWARLAEGLHRFGDRAIYLDDTSTTVQQIRATARRLALEHGLDLIIADYLQLIEGREGKRTENRTQEVSQISRDFKRMLKALRVPGIALAQVSRLCETRPDKRPMLSDLRESGQIEQDANVVAFLHREEIYNPTEENQSLAELIVAKNRDGAQGVVNLAFLKEFTRFEPMWREGY